MLAGHDSSSSSNSGFPSSPIPPSSLPAAPPLVCQDSGAASQTPFYHAESALNSPRAQTCCFLLGDARQSRQQQQQQLGFPLVANTTTIASSGTPLYSEPIRYGYDCQIDIKCSLAEDGDARQSRQQQLGLPLIATIASSGTTSHLSRLGGRNPPLLTRRMVWPPLVN